MPITGHKKVFFKIKPFPRVTFVPDCGEQSPKAIVSSFPQSHRINAYLSSLKNLAHLNQSKWDGLAPQTRIILTTGVFIGQCAQPYRLSLILPVTSYSDC